MGIKDLLHHLKDIVERWYELGVQVDVPISKLNEIRCNNLSDVYQCKLLMLQEWQRQLTQKPSWCTLVDALHKMEENVIANKIAQHFSEFHFGLIYVLSSFIASLCYFRAQGGGACECDQILSVLHIVCTATLQPVYML